ncbi:hypothetical protein ACVW0P_002415 [Mucilaginibacter sp. UYNi724]
MAVTQLSPIQKERLQRLESALKISVSNADLTSIKIIIQDLQPIYLSTGNDAKLLMAKNRWLEVEMEQGNLLTAERGLLGIRVKANKKTRVYLEATCLLAICYLRTSEIDKAEPMIKEVLINDTVITSLERRAKFRRLAIERFDEEATLYAIKADKVYDILSNVRELEDDAIHLSNDFSQDELYENLGQKVPKIAKDILAKVDAFSKKQLPSAERLRLPSPTQINDDKKIGITVFSSVKRALYKSICDKEGDIFKKINAGIAGIQTTITVAVAEIFSSLSIGIRVLVVGVIAIIFKLGLGVYCERFKPIDIMDLR